MNPFMSHQNDLPVEEGRYSFGTTPAIDKIIDLVNHAKNDQGYIFLINLSTLVRNRWRKELKLQRIVDGVRQDMSGISNELNEVCKLKDPEHAHLIVFYTMSYSKMIPSEYIRSQDSEQRAKVQDATAMLINQVPSTKKVDGNFTVVVEHSKSSEASFKQLSKMIKNVGGSQVVTIISHQPIDYHIFDVNIKGNVVKSFTGDIESGSKSTLGSMVFKDPNVPFYPSLHVLLGDKELIKGSLDRKEKVRLLEMCASNGWRMRTNTYIADALFKNKFTLPYTLENK